MVSILQGTIMIASDHAGVWGVGAQVLPTFGL
jgi:hypothetical protein